MDKSQQQIINELVQKTMAELSTPEKPKQNSRTWQNPNGFKYLVQWSNLVLLRSFIRTLTASLPRSEYRRKAQADDAARSCVRNLEEGFKRGDTATYLEFISFTQGSLEEVKGDIRELTEDGYLKSLPGSSLAGIGINLGEFNKILRPDAKYIKQNYRNRKGELKDFKGNIESENPLYQSSRNPLNSSKGKLAPESDKDFAYSPLTVLYPPLTRVKASNLTYEIFIELINKSDFLLRNLVQSLEKKLNGERKGYKISQARIKDKIR